MLGVHVVLAHEARCMGEVVKLSPIEDNNELPEESRPIIVTFVVVEAKKHSSGDVVEDYFAWRNTTNSSLLVSLKDLGLHV